MRTRVPSSPLGRPLARLAVGLVVGASTLTACGGGSSDDGSQAPSTTGGASSSATASTPSGAPTGSPSPSPTSSPTSSSSSSQSSSPTGTPTAAPAGGLRGRLLTASEVPGPNDGFRWRQGATRAEDPRASFATCQRFAITSIGAERVLVRSFTPATAGAAGDRAGSLVATFPDPKTARRAYAVLQAWRGRCADRLTSYRHRDVGSLESVPVGGGSAGAYLLTYGPVRGRPDDAYFDAQGMAVVGSRIAVVTLRVVGQDYNYEAGQEPVVAAVQRAARKLA
jgi:hypothetical protein